MIAPGTRLGPYEILSALGAGGMGEVYRARDTKLNRDVAIKVLPDLFASDAERLARFTREAQTLASLNHPNIAHIHGLEESNGVRALVMELVEGEDLSQRIARGPISIDEALPIAKQIAEALEAAHEQGIIHRDLKPANIKVRPDGTVKVLDFGLAKAMETAPAASDLTHSPTLSMMATQAGVILGTAAYMSPEQAKGFPADQRSDVFSFGSVLYEMLTGRQPFKGDTAPDVLASVLVREPDLDLLPPNLNPRIPELLRRCLEKNPKKRWQAVGDLRAEIEAIAAAPRVAPAIAQVIAPTQPLWKRAIPVVAAAIVVGALSSIATLYFRPSTTAAAHHAIRVHTRGGPTVDECQPPSDRNFTGRHEDGLRGQLSRVPAFDVGARGAAYPRNREHSKANRVEPYLFAGWQIHRVLVGSRSDTQADSGHRWRGGDHLPGHESFRHGLGRRTASCSRRRRGSCGSPPTAANRNGSSTRQVRE